MGEVRAREQEGKGARGEEPDLSWLFSFYAEGKYEKEETYGGDVF